MAGQTVIRVEGVSKMYVLGQSRSQGGLRHAIEDAVKAPLRWLRPKPPATSSANEFWALNDISFDIQHGDVVGIIGRNGAGKSTLLKILSRITEPTKGRIGIKGRIASLLEVGTGFHPELTGKENIFLNGAILGMRQAEVRRKFDEIVAFADVEKFLDTPVKRYSSGMYVRLAFAVAAHLESEVLIVDEVLSVGDAEFQKKCLGKMRQVTNEGRTVLFVSHDLAAVSALCQKGIVLKNGRLAFQGSGQDALAFYSSDTAASAKQVTSDDLQRRQGTGSHRIMGITPDQEEFPARSDMTFSVRIKNEREEGPFHLALNFLNERDERIYCVTTEFLENCSLQAGDQEVKITIKSPWFPPGEYHINADLFSQSILDLWENACRFRIGTDVAKDGYSYLSARQCGKIMADFNVQVQAADQSVKQSFS